uniref:Nup54 domain-containing protein n=1 Tax=Haemonchus contortus TaxID=6289 RepID=A0A7I4YK04_HAECO
GMSLFGSKPLFGSTSTSGTSSGFTFGSTTTTTSTPSLFGSTTTTTPASKPLFGSVPQSGTTTSLFGTATTTSGGLFGAKTTTTTASGGLFGSSTSGGLFSKPGTGFGTGGTGLFGSKPMTGGLFGSAAAAQPAMETKQTVQGLLQESDALVRSLTKVELFGDERDEMIAKLNQLAAALGVGVGYYKDGQQPVHYTQGGPFHRIKAIGYNRTSQHTDSDGIVALVVKAPMTEYQTSEQKQKFVDALFVILGSKPTIHAHIESVTALPDNFTEICIYATEKFRGRISSKDLAQYLNQAAQKQQLETQLKVDKDKIVSRVQMDKQQKELYLRDPPTGFDASVWAQAVRENPDPERFVPYPIRGFEQLRARQKVQLDNIQAQNHAVDAMKSRISRIEANVSAVSVQLARQKVIQKQLSHRLLRVLSMQLLAQRFTHGIDATEESMQSALESINVRLNGPQQVKSRIAEISETLRVEGATLRSALSKESNFLDEADALNLKRYLDRCQDGLESLVAVVESSFDDIQLLMSSADA